MVKKEVVLEAMLRMIKDIELEIERINNEIKRIWVELERIEKEVEKNKKRIINIARRKKL